jgi:phosphoribosylamine---glycine ligase
LNETKGFAAVKILVIGSGGREHALAWKLAQSPGIQRILVSPGNAGTAREHECLNVPGASVDDWVAIVERESVSLTIVGPEAPLAAGVVDALRARGHSVFGPTKAAAQLESSKAFAKAFMQRHNIPTAHYATFDDLAKAQAYVHEKGAPIVIKYDGLAAGKGVVVAMTRIEAFKALEKFLDKPGDQVVIEEFLEGEEASFIVMSDGKNVLPMATSQDHKRLKDEDEGPNTGGMGAYSPAPVVTPTVHARIMREIISPTIAGMAAEGTPFTGFLYAGVMIDAAGNAKVIEFNARMGDPETQPIMMRLKSDFLKLVQHAIAGTLDQVEAQWDRRTALAIVAAAANYPDTPRTGDAITFGELPKTPLGEEELKVFHAGTTLDANGDVLTAGGRVLAVTAMADAVKHAQTKAYEALANVRFDGMQYRTDIGHRGVKR